MHWNFLSATTLIGVNFGTHTFRTQRRNAAIYNDFGCGTNGLRQITTREASAALDAAKASQQVVICVYKQSCGWY